MKYVYVVFEYEDSRLSYDDHSVIESVYETEENAKKRIDELNKNKQAWISGDAYYIKFELTK